MGVYAAVHKCICIYMFQYILINGGFLCPLIHAWAILLPPKNKNLWPENGFDYN